MHIRMYPNCSGHAIGPRKIVAKFQHFSAETIVSDFGFKSLKKQLSHQSKWKKSVFQTYKDASINLNWTNALKKTCDEVGIAFFTSPYSFELVDHVDKYVPAYKVGSGDITWHSIIKYMAKKNKPMIIATGASTFKEVKMVVDKVYKINKKVCLMQCNTNYTNSSENFNYINLNVLKLYKKFFPKLILGLSDHTQGHTTVLGAIALGARVVEKHFTINNNLEGSDHKFSMNPSSWKEMILRARELEQAMGIEEKKVEKNEKNTVNVQRRSIRLNKNLKKGDVIRTKDLVFLRPCPEDAIPPYLVNKVSGKKIKISKLKGDYIKLKDL